MGDSFHNKNITFSVVNIITHPSTELCKNTRSRRSRPRESGRASSIYSTASGSQTTGRLQARTTVVAQTMGKSWGFHRMQWDMWYMYIMIINIYIYIALNRCVYIYPEILIYIYILDIINIIN